MLFDADSQVRSPIFFGHPIDPKRRLWLCSKNPSSASFYLCRSIDVKQGYDDTDSSPQLHSRYVSECCINRDGVFYFYFFERRSEDSLDANYSDFQNSKSLSFRELRHSEGYAKTRSKFGPEPVASVVSDRFLVGYNYISEHV